MVCGAHDSWGHGRFAFVSHGSACAMWFVYIQTNDPISPLHVCVYVSTYRVRGRHKEPRVRTRGPRTSRSRAGVALASVGPSSRWARSVRAPPPGPKVLRVGGTSRRSGKTFRPYVQQQATRLSPSDVWRSRGALARTPYQPHPGTPHPARRPLKAQRQASRAPVASPRPGKPRAHLARACRPPSCRSETAAVGTPLARAHRARA